MGSDLYFMSRGIDEYSVGPLKRDLRRVTDRLAQEVGIDDPLVAEVLENWSSKGHRNDGPSRRFKFNCDQETE